MITFDYWAIELLHDPHALAGIRVVADDVTNTSEVGTILVSRV